MYLWQNNISNSAVLVFRGFYSNPDSIQELIWYENFGRDILPGVSTNNWLSLNNSASSITSRDPMRNFYYRLILDSSAPSMYNSFENSLSSSGVSSSNIDDKYYFALAQALVDTVLPNLRQQNSSIYITGHSMGGALASLISLWLVERDNTTYETTTFGPIGSICVGRSFHSNDLSGSVSDAHILSYVDPYDLYPQIDYIPGKVCYIPSQSGTSTNCANVVGKGIELFYPGSQDQEDWRICTIASNSIYYMYQVINTSAVNSDGTTNSCFFVNVGTCGSYTVGVDYVFFIIFNIVIAIIFLAALAIGIFVLVRIIYLKVTGNHANIFFCCPYGCSCCKSCECCKTKTYQFGDVELY